MNKLFIVSTPIGNLKDITERAKEVLSNVSVVLAEDSRETSKLFNLIGIENKIVSLHK
jgi:16S rRNA (cytidine1402-2'-O)-methyltransferase